MAAPTAEIAMRWTRDLKFEGGAAERPAIVVDGDGEAATSPVQLLLLAAATCTAADIVLILKKQRVHLAALDVAVRGTRRETAPRRYTAIHFAWTVRGEGADEMKVRRAVDLSIEKYCSVIASLATDITISYDVAIA